MARRDRNARNVNGIFLLDKREGVSSNAALQEVKKIFNARKGGHTGSLDPLATGLLPVCLGEATKLSPYLLNSDKRYRVSVRLGISTNTGDAEGEVVERMPVPTLSREHTESVLNQFRGEIDQTPPMHSALKHKGRPLYELARKGIEIERKSRTISIYELDLLDLGDNAIELDVFCSKGTYIRSLAEDISKHLGTCGFVEQLRRTAVGDFLIDQSRRIESLRSNFDPQRFDNYLLPMDAALKSWPSVRLSHELSVRIRQGQVIRTEANTGKRLVKLVSQTNQFFAIGEITGDGRIAPRRIFNIGS